MIMQYNTSLPSLPEQEKIGAFLSQLDDRIEKQEQKIALLKERKKEWMQQLFSQTIRFKDENGQDYPAWEEKKLGEIVEVQMCKRIFKEQTTSYGEIPFFKIGTLGKVPDAFISKELFEEYKEKYNYPRVGEVMMTCSGTVGKSFPYNGYQAYYQDSNIIWLRNDENIVSNLFLLYSVKNMTWNTLSSTTIKRIYNKDIYQKKVSYPSLPEQEKIAKFLSKQDELIEKEEEKLSLLKAQKKGLLQQMFV